MKRLMEYLGPVRDKVLAHAQLKEDETLLDIGCGDGADCVQNITEQPPRSAP
jgi:cyclopropane fatty-acyl-phospholipid synthase-like methyltransferase